MAIGGLISYGLFSWCHNAELKTFVAIFGGISIFVTLWGVLGFTIDDKRRSVNIKIFSAVFAFLMLVSNIVFCCLESFSQPTYIIINALLLLLWLLLVYSFFRYANSSK